MSNICAPAAKKPGPKPMPRGCCVVEGCEATADHPVSGLCENHYRQLRRTGSFESSRRQRGKGTVTKYGYVSRGVDGKKKQEHVLVAERALGKPLPPGAEVHHVNENRQDNRPENLVICPDKAYHKLIHVRMAALEACGNANYRKCPFCKQYSDPADMKHNPSSRYYYHAACKTEYRKSRSDTK